MLTYVTISHSQRARPTLRQADLDRIANDLDIKVAMETNHLAGETNKIVFQLQNRGRRKILDKNGWKILFSMRDANSLTQPEFEVHGLAIQAGDGCFFEMSKKPKSRRQFPGLEPGQAFKITIQKRGLSVFKYDIDNNFIVTAPGLQARTIDSTKDEELGFVFLAAANKTKDDFSIMNPFRRAIIAADIRDMGRLGRDMIVPKTLNISDMVAGELIDFQEAKNIYVWPDSAVSNEFKDYLQSKSSDTTVSS